MAEKKAEKPEVKAEPQAQAPERKPVEAWKEALRTPEWLFVAAKAKYRWPVGFEATEGDYKAALEATLKEVIK